MTIFSKETRRICKRARLAEGREQRGDFSEKAFYSSVVRAIMVPTRVRLFDEAASMCVSVTFRNQITTEDAKQTTQDARHPVSQDSDSDSTRRCTSCRWKFHPYRSIDLSLSWSSNQL